MLLLPLCYLEAILPRPKHILRISCLVLRVVFVRVTHLRQESDSDDERSEEQEAIDGLAGLRT